MKLKLYSTYQNIITTLFYGYFNPIWSNQLPIPFLWCVVKWILFKMYPLLSLTKWVFVYFIYFPFIFMSDVCVFYYVKIYYNLHFKIMIWSCCFGWQYPHSYTHRDFSGVPCAFITSLTLQGWVYKLALQLYRLGSNTCITHHTFTPVCPHVTSAFSRSLTGCA